MKKILIFILIVLAVMYFMRDILIKTTAEKGTEIVTGFQLQIGSLKTDIAKNSIEIRNLKLLNPSSFEERVMLDMPEIYVACDFLAILTRGILHVPELRVDISTFNVVKNKMGLLNLDSLKSLQQTQAASRKETKPAPQGTKPLQLIVDKLSLKVGKVTFKDYTKTPAAIQEFNIRLNEKYERINNLNLVVSMIVAKALMQTTIGQLADFDVSGLNSSVGNAWSASKEQMSAMASKAQAAIAEKTPEAVKEKASQAKNWLTSKTKSSKEQVSTS